MDKVIGNNLIISRPSVGNSYRSSVLQIAERTVVTLGNVRIASLLIPVYIVVEAGTQTKAEVDVLVLNTRAQTSGIRSCGTLVEVAVGISQLAVTITVDEDTLQWLAILTINLLIDIEGISRMTNSLCLNLVTSTCRNSTCQDDRRLTSQFGNLVLIIREVTGYLPRQIVIHNRTYGQRSLKTLIL